MRRLPATPSLLLLILLLAAALRVATAWGPSAHHPDEIFQYLEQAHRLVFGYGYVPWEYRDGMRGWLVPLLLAGPMWLGDAIAPDTQAYLLLPRLAVALATVGIVWAGWRVGARVSRTHALVAAIVAATWFEQAHYAGHTLTETIATAAALPALALLASEKRRDLALAGALLAFAALARFHYAPALAVAAAWRCRLDARAWAAVIAGAAPALAASALVDAAMGMTPFDWVWANVRRNVIENASATYGVSGPGYYLDALVRDWGAAFVPLVALALLGARRRPDLLAVALVTIALHTGIGHKEERFVLLATTCLLVLAALGTGDAVALAPERWRRMSAAGALAVWIAASTLLALTPPMRARWSNEAPALSAAARAGREGTCGMATWDMRYWQSGGWTFLHRNVPIYPVSARDELGVPAADARTLALISPAFDTILAPLARERDMPRGYARITCRVPPAPLASPADQAARAICLYRRPGRCDPTLAEPWRLR